MTRTRWLRGAVVLGLACATALLAACGDGTTPESDGTATGPAPDQMCDPPQQPIAAAYELETGEFRWASCADATGHAYLAHLTADGVYVSLAPDTQTHTLLDADTGAVIDDAAPAPSDPGVRTSTLVDGIRITGGQDDPTIARDTDGSQIWSQPGTWTYDDVVAIDDGAVFAVERGERLVAYEIPSGEVRWAAPGAAHTDSLWPWVARDGRLVTAWANLQVRSTTDGTIVWATRWPVNGFPFPDRHVSGVAVDEDTVYVGLTSQSGPGD